MVERLSSSCVVSSVFVMQVEEEAFPIAPLKQGPMGRGICFNSCIEVCQGTS